MLLQNHGSRKIFVEFHGSSMIQSRSFSGYLRFAVLTLSQSCLAVCFFGKAKNVLKYGDLVAFSFYKQRLNVLETENLELAFQTI